MSQLSVIPKSCNYCGSFEFIKKGYFYKTSTRTYIPRYRCKCCSKSFSTRTLSPTYKQKRTDLNVEIYKSHNEGMSLRAIARKNHCSYKTVYLKFKWLSERAEVIHFQQKFSVKELQFDETESIEHTKLKPLSIALAVSKDFQILGVKVGTIPAKGKLIYPSTQKYGKREDESALKTRELLNQIKAQLAIVPRVIKSDKKPIYKEIVESVFPTVAYKSYLSRGNKEKRREEKHKTEEKKQFDPLFALNQRCAKLRSDIKRMHRRSWCTTKRKDHLEKNLYLYIAYNNGYDLFA